MGINNQMTLEQQLAQALAENTALKAEKLANAKTGMKITEKGGLSVYGLGRFPVTLYLSQWEKLIGMVDKIKAFIEANRSKFSTK